jgi:hypothetical protein
VSQIQQDVEQVKNELSIKTYNVKYNKYFTRTAFKIIFIINNSSTQLKAVPVDIFLKAV